jgi:hypothetical protein
MRLDLHSKQAVETTALWLDTSDWKLKPLRQIYRGKSDTAGDLGHPRESLSKEARAHPSVRAAAPMCFNQIGRALASHVS